MISVGIDVSKDKHDCCIISQQDVAKTYSFSIPNNFEGFDTLFDAITSYEQDLSKVKVGLEATGHYSFNILGYLLEKGTRCYVLNPLLTNQYRKSQTLRKTKTDKVDSKMIAKMLLSEVDLKPYTKALYHNSELKSLTRYRFSLVKRRSLLKTQVARLVNILFPELESIVPSLHMASVYALLHKYPCVKDIATANIKHLTDLLTSASRGRYQREKAEEIKALAKRSIGLFSRTKALELKHTIEEIIGLDDSVEEIEKEIKTIIKEKDIYTLSIPGIGPITAATIYAEIGDFSLFESPDKVLAFAGLSPTTYQSGKLDNAHPHMEKRGSKYLRNALFLAAEKVALWAPEFSAYMAKKRNEGKHYYVAISHVIKKLVRVIYCLETTHQQYRPLS